MLVFHRVRVAISSLLALACATSVAHAAPYESFIDVDDEGDLQDLLSAGTITEDTYNELLDLLSRGVDLASADRNELYTLPNLTYEDVDAIIAYRTLNRGRIKDPAELVTAGALSEEKLLGISSFLIVREAADNKLTAHGWVRAMTRATPHDFSPYSPQDPFVPPLGLRARVTAMRHLVAGLAITTTRLEIGDPVYDPARGALVAEQRSLQFHAPKAYVKWETDSLAAIGGTYRAGFGQRLVFDNSSAYSPNGLYLDDQLFYSSDLATACKESQGELISSPCTGKRGDEHITPDFAWRDGLFGAGVGAKKIELATGWLQAYAFGSVSRRSIYQYELVDRGKCKDPHDDNDPNCDAPVVFVKPDGDLLTATSRHSFATLPNVFQERLAGGNIAYFADRRNTVGITGYGAKETNLVGGIDLDFQEWSRLPTGKRFGAVGANFAFGRGWLDLFGEAAVSFDAMPKQDPSLTPAKGGGGPAALLRMTATRKKEEIEVIARYFSTDFLNPYGRPIAESDEFEGQRARDEAGGRVRYTRTNKEIVIRALADVWINPSAKDIPAAGTTPAFKAGPKIDTYVRVNVKTTPELWLGLWERFQDKNLAMSGHNQCFEITSDTTQSGEPIPCAGMQLQTIVRATYEPNKRMSGTIQLEHQLLDDNTQMELKTKFRQDVAAWFVGYYRPSKDTHLRVRVRYLDEAINDNTYLERSVAALADVAQKVRERDTVRVRLDAKFWLDKRLSTIQRVPDPELTLWLFYEAKL